MRMKLGLCARDRAGRRRRGKSREDRWVGGGIVVNCVQNSIGMREIM
jgi:hypothetical protein